MLERDHQRKTNTCHNRQSRRTLGDLVTDKVSFDIAADQEAQKAAARLEGIIHHFLRIDQKLTVNIVHRIWLERDVQDNADGRENAGQRQDIEHLVVAVNALFDDADNDDQHDALRHTYRYILRCMHAEEIARKARQQDQHTAQDRNPSALVPLPNSRIAVMHGCGKCMTARERISCCRCLGITRGHNLIAADSRTVGTDGEFDHAVEYLPYPCRRDKTIAEPLIDTPIDDVRQKRKDIDRKF